MFVQKVCSLALLPALGFARILGKPEEERQHVPLHLHLDGLDLPVARIAVLLFFASGATYPGELGLGDAHAGTDLQQVSIDMGPGAEATAGSGGTPSGAA